MLLKFKIKKEEEEEGTFTPTLTEQTMKNKGNELHRQTKPPYYFFLIFIYTIF